MAAMERLVRLDRLPTHDAVAIYAGHMTRATTPDREQSGPGPSRLRALPSSIGAINQYTLYAKLVGWRDIAVEALSDMQPPFGTLGMACGQSVKNHTPAESCR